MRCQVGVHTRRIVLQFTEHDWANAIMIADHGQPAAIGHRSWFIQEMGGKIVAERSSHGTSPFRLARRPDLVTIHNDFGTIVRCESHEREVAFPRRGRMEIAMPPHHEWPWMAMQQRIKRITPLEWRWLLVQEINARVKSAREHGADMPINWPKWVDRMLTPDDRLCIMHNGELAR